ncbi:MAG: hypothetical protein KC994_09600 [Candidatus Omnitrophica bacterium]|nr:hypothetical protein [Candidatus Omnitrophota bacterium]
MNDTSPQFPIPGPQTGERTERYVSTFLVTVLVVFAAFFLYHAARTILYPYTVDYGEGFLLNQGNELAHLRSPYQPLDEPPWLVANYPPVYPALLAIGIKAFGIQYYFGRALSLFGILVAGYCLYAMTRDQTGNRLAAWVSLLVWLGSYPVYAWGPYHRVDSVGIGFEALGLLFLMKRERLTLSILFFLLALYCRQTLWMAPLAGYFYLRRMDGPRFAARWFGKLLVLGGGIFLILTLLTGGEFFRHLVSYNANPYHIKDVWRNAHNGLFLTMLLPTLFLIYTLVRVISTGKWDLLGYCIPFSILTFFLVGKLGSAVNYLFEIALVSAWATGVVIAEAQYHIPKGNPLRLMPALFLGVGICFPLHVPHFYNQWSINDWAGTPISSSRVMTDELAYRLKEIEEPVLSQDAGLSLMTGHKLVWQPFIMTQLHQQKRWNQEPLLEMIRNKEFKALVLPINFELDTNLSEFGLWWTQFDEEMVETIRTHYRVAPRINPAANRGQDPRWVWGYHSPFGTNYLYFPK